MKYIKIFESFKSIWISKFFKDKNFRDFLNEIGEELRLSEIKDIETDGDVIKFMSAIEGYDYKLNENINESNDDSDECPGCDGAGSLKCYECDGGGEAECPECVDGDDSDGNICEACDGSNKVTCTVCDGDGRRECMDCDGSGKIGQSEETEDNMSDGRDVIRYFTDDGGYSYYRDATGSYNTYKLPSNSDDSEDSDELSTELIKAFFDEDVGLVALLDKNNIRLNRSPNLPSVSHDIFGDIYISRYDREVSKEKVVKSADYCLIINYTLLIDKYSTKSELISQREEQKSNALALKSDELIKAENIERYEQILFAKYGFDSNLENFKKGIIFFNKRVFNNIPPVAIIMYIEDFSNLFDLIKKSLLYLELYDEELNRYKSQIKSLLKRLFRTVDGIYNTDAEISDKILELSKHYESIAYFNKYCWSHIKNFNAAFKIESDKIEDIADVMKYCDGFNTLNNFINSVEIHYDLLTYLYRRGTSGISNMNWCIPSEEDGFQRLGKKLEIITKTTIKIFK